MIVTPIYNLDLLKIIYKLKTCMMDELKAEYLNPGIPDVTFDDKTSLNKDLQILAELGTISIDNNNIKFITFQVI